MFLKLKSRPIASDQVLILISTYRIINYGNRLEIHHKLMIKTEVGRNLECLAKSPNQTDIEWARGK